MKSSKKRAAIYARVSTAEGKQTPENQLRELREYVDRRGFELVGEYVDHATGTKSDRENYQRLLADARQRNIDVVLVWRYDRFARSVQALINALKEFQSLGVDFISHQEQIDTTTPQGELIFAIMAGLAQFESRLIGDRVRSGMARAKAQGKRVARPPLSLETQEKIRELSAQGSSLRAISRTLGITKPTVIKYRKEAS